MSQIFIPSFNPALTVAGLQAASAKMAFYLSGTNTLATVYDENGDPLSQAANVYGTVGVAADITGRFPQIYLGDETSYRVVLRTAQGAQIGNEADPYTNLEKFIEDALADLLSADGAGKIGFSHAETYPAGTLGAKGKLTINIQDPPFNAVPGTDCTAAVQAAWAYAASLAVTVDGFKSLMPTINLGPGRIIITSVNALAASFTSGSTWSGIHLVGAGRGQTILEYSSTSSASNNWLANYENCRNVTWENMTVKSTDSDLRGILWGPNGASTNGQGSYWTCRGVTFEGPWTKVFYVQGTSLGSETKWYDVAGSAGFASGTFFEIDVSNPQSVNHAFFGCTLGGIGTTFKLRAGGALSVYGGFSTIGEGGTYLDVNGTGAVIGSNNGGILIEGVTFEDNNVTACVLVNNDSPADIVFSKCTMAALDPSGSGDVVILGSIGNQRSGSITFDNCRGPLNKTTVSNGVTLRYKNCTGMSDWQDYITLQRGNSSNYYAPFVDIDGSVNTSTIVDCYPKVLENDYLSVPQAILPLGAVPEKQAYARDGNTGLTAGLLVGQGGAYASWTFEIPLWATVTQISIFYQDHASASTDARDFKITADSGAYTLLPVTNVADPTVQQVLDSGPIMYTAVNEGRRLITVSGTTAFGTAPDLLGDFGYVVVKYR